MNKVEHTGYYHTDLPFILPECYAVPEVNFWGELLTEIRKNEASKLFFECMQKEKATNTLATNSLI